MNNEKYIRWFVILLVGFSINFFSPRFLLTSPLGNLRFLYVFLAVLLAVPFFAKRKGGFILPVQMITVAQVLSVFMAYFFWGQSFIDSFKSTILLMIWPVFFFLLEKRMYVSTIEKIIIGYGIAYVLLFFFQYTHSNVVYFGTVDEYVQDRGVTRINFPAAGIFFLSSFIALNKVNAAGKSRWLYILLALLGVVITVMQVTRQSIALVLVIYLFHFMKDAQLYKKVLVLMAFVVAVFAFINSNNAIVNGFRESQKDKALANSEAIRVLSGTYYLTKFSPTVINSLFGNGVPYKGTKDASDYGNFDYKLQTTFGFYLSDVGIIGFYAMFGLLAVVGYIMIFIKSFTVNVPREFYYLKYYLWYLLATCLTSDSVFSYYNLMATVLVLYIYQLLYERGQAGQAVLPQNNKSLSAWS